MKKINSLIVVIFSAFLLCSCGSSSKSDAAASAEAKYAMPEEAYDEVAYDNGYSDEMVSESMSYDSDNEMTEITESDVESGNNSNVERMLIKNIHLEVESEDVSILSKNIENRVNALGGYVENMSMDKNEYSTYTRRTAYMVARIPANKLDNFVAQVEGESNVLSKSSNTEDVTLRYVDMQSKLESLNTEYDRLNELIEKADDLDTIIALESRLTEIRYQIESYASQLKVMKNQVTYSTVSISMTQVIEYTRVDAEQKTAVQRMSEGFVDNCKAVAHGISEFFIGLVIALPVLVIWAAIITGIVFVIRAIIKRIKNNKQEKKVSFSKKSKIVKKEIVANEEIANTKETEENKEENKDGN